MCCHQRFDVGPSVEVGFDEGPEGGGELAGHGCLIEGRTIDLEALDRRYGLRLKA